jgi:hypothetical protein
MSQFLLPCVCGSKIPVNRSQAGMSLACSQCGQVVEVPTIRNLSQFEVVSSPTARPKSMQLTKWLGPVAVLSLLVGLFGLAYAGFLYYERSGYYAMIRHYKADIKMTEADFAAKEREFAMRSTPADTWDNWNKMLSGGLQDPDPPDFFRVKRFLEKRWPTLVWTSTVGLVGMLVFGLCTVVIQKSRKRMRL